MTTRVRGAIDFSKKFRFRDFQIYKDARAYAFDLKRATQDCFPNHELYALRSQLWRALDSIILNIAEGADRSTDKDFALFLNRSHTSLNEVVACLDIALDNQYITEEIHNEYLQRLAALGNQITAFRNSILKKG